ncbi:MAG: hypothetical protein JWO82_3939 [Akkermansiaceae bacterium]|nr:hypothetical protein [Akkermansiaceae bacterium]
MTYPLHRSLLFWSGLFCVAFLLWAWTDSGTHRSGASLRRVAIISSAGRVTFAVNLGFPWPETAQRNLQSPSSDSGILAQHGYHEIREDAVKINLFTVNYLMLIAFFTAAWLALLLWRIRRHRRLATPPENPGEEVTPPAVSSSHPLP